MHHKHSHLGFCVYLFFKVGSWASTLEIQGCGSLESLLSLEGQQVLDIQAPSLLFPIEDPFQDMLHPTSTGVFMRIETAKWVECPVIALAVGSVSLHSPFFYSFA